MKSRIIYFLAFLLCCAGLGVSVFCALRKPVENPESRHKMELQVDVDTIDIGTIRQQETRNVAFHLRNTSQNDLSLESVHTSCGCTEWHLDKRQLKRDESAELSVTFSSGQARGSMAATIRVFYRNLETEETGNLFLTLFADVLPDYDISPAILEFTAKTESTQYVTLKPRFSEDIKVIDISCTRDYYEIEIVENEPMVKVTFLKGKKLPGEKNAILEIKTTSQRQPVYRIPLFCEDM